jgi:predicted ribosome quality control (RQC) complex YloA/Tae2 family protein
MHDCIQGGILMALDGIVLSNIVSDFTHLLLDGRIDKIYQPESDEIIFSI